MKAASRDNKDTGARTYPYPPTGEPFPSVTTIGSATEGKPQLVHWASRIAAQFTVAHLDVITKTLAEEGPDAAVALILAEARRLRDVKADAGSYVHAVAEALTLWASDPDHGAEVRYPSLDDDQYRHLIDAEYDGDTVPKVVDLMVTGWVNFVTRWQPTFLASEMTVFNVTLKYAGTLDAILVLRDVDVEEIVLPNGRRRCRLISRPGHVLVLCVDIKTGRWLEGTVYEQLGAYMHAEQALVGLGDLVDMPRTDYAAVLHCRPYYRGGYRLRIFPREDTTRGWNRFLRTVDIFWGRKPYAGRTAGQAVHLPRPDGTPEPPHWEDLAVEGDRRVANLMLTNGQLTVEDTSCLTAADLLSMKGVGKATLASIRTILAADGLALADETLDPEITPNPGEAA